MSMEPTDPPVVFVSYSHDSREHKQWAAQLAAALLENHVQVIFDQWDLEPGDDVPKFMERAVKAADRVLMICTEPYVRKANDGKGGVGYEAMIVTGELVRDLGTRKFIPIIRQRTSEPVVPDCVSTRLWVDFSKEEDFASSLDTLIRSLHQAQRLTKPTLGPDPFAGLRSPSEETKIRHNTIDVGFEAVLGNPSAAYRLAASIAASGDTSAWRKLLRALDRNAATNLVAWRSSDTDLPVSSEDDPSPLYDHAAKGIALYMPLFACLVAGAESGKEEFANQLSWIDEVLAPANWERGGYTYWIDFPQLLLFVGQALVGGMLMESKASEAACELATARIPENYRSRESLPLFLETSITGWPESMNHNSTIAWGFLTSILNSTDWINEAFGSQKHAQASISSYYQLLSFMNFCHLSTNGRFEHGDLSWAISVPLNFCHWSGDSAKKGYRTFLGHRLLLRKLLDANGLGEPTRFRQHWDQWLDLCRRSLRNAHQWHLRLEIPQTRLPEDLENHGFSLK